jgi:hypothetical protein
MRSNKINNINLFTERVNFYYRKHIKTQRKRVLEVIDQVVDWEALL